jgi:hypothetical protein
MRTEVRAVIGVGAWLNLTLTHILTHIHTNMHTHAHTHTNIHTHILTHIHTIHPAPADGNVNRDACHAESATIVAADRP